jgi:hypothetical protein
MPLDDREEALFRTIEAELRADDPALAARLGGRSPWRERLAPWGERLAPWRDRLSRGAWPVVAIVAGLAVLPLAAELRLYPIGLVGYALATFAGAAVARRRSARRRPVPETSPAGASDGPTDATEPGAGDGTPGPARVGGPSRRLLIGGAAAVAALVAFTLPGPPASQPPAEASPGATAPAGPAAGGTVEDRAGTVDPTACRPPAHDCDPDGAVRPGTG